jgi:hypothetical protein
MLRITRDQRGKVGDPAFVDRVVQHFQLFHLEAVHWMSDAELRRRIRHGIEIGRSYGLTWEYSLTVFVAHMFRIHPEFHLQPAIHQVLSDQAIPPDDRINELPAKVTDGDWDEAYRRGDPEVYWRAHGAPLPGARE